MTQRYDLFINNDFVAPDGDDYFPAYNPYTGDVHAMIPQASDAQVAQAVAAARTAFDTVWSKTSGLERSKLLGKLADLLEQNAERMAILETTDNGKVIRETKGQMLMAARSYRFYAGAADKIFGQSIPLDQKDVFDYTAKEPLGVCVLITAWNSPMSILCMKLAPALAAGNCVVIKPSEHASSTTLELAKLIKEAGFPAGVVNVTTGDYRVGKALTRSGRVDRVSFTGSPQVGRSIAADAGERLIPVTLELGGKSPNIIFDDADLDKAVVGALAGIFAATGQTCIAGSRLVVQRGVYDEVIARLAKRAGMIKLGNPLDMATEMGTAANEPQFRRILERIEKARAEGDRRQAGDGAGPGNRLFHRTHDLRRCDQRHGACAGRGVRAGPCHPSLRHRGRGDRDRQRHALWPRIRGLDARHLARDAHGEGDRGRDGLGQHLPLGPGHGALRRVQGLGLRQRAGHGLAG